MSTFDKYDLYADNYYEYIVPVNRSPFPVNNTVRSDEPEITTSTSTMFRGILTILLRIGFLLVQIGSVPVNNVNLILLQNIADLCIVTIVYALIGFIIAFNGDIGGMIGKGVWIGQSQVNKEEAIVGWAAVVTASAICTCGTSGRMHAVGYLLIGALLTGVVQPFLLHWAWTPKGWMADGKLFGRRVSFRDHAGSGIVHMAGGLSGLIGCLVLGRRLVLLEDIDDASLPVSSSGTTFAGHLLVLLGLQGLAPPGHKGSYGWHDSHVLLNNLLAATSCSLFVIALHFALSREAFNYWTVTRCIQATVAGVVTVAAGVDAYSPPATLAVGCAGAVVFYLTSRRVFRSALEDYCNVVAAHLICALLGSFLSPFCVTMRSGTDYFDIILDLTWQVIGLVALVSFVAFVMSLAFILLKVLGILRNRSEIMNHLRSVAALEQEPHRSYMQRLFFPAGETLYLQPGASAKNEPDDADATVSELSNYRQQVERLVRARLVEPRHEPEETIDIEAVRPSRPPRTNRFRQIHTIRTTTMTSSHARVESTGGDGETMTEGDRSEDTKMIVETLTGLENPDAATLKIDEGPVFDEPDQRDPWLKEPQYQLHRTRKLTSLHVEELEEETSGHELYVKVLVEPRRRSFSSSDSDHESSREEPEESLNELQERFMVIKDTCGSVGLS